jgi:hypothetical protein
VEWRGLGHQVQRVRELPAGGRTVLAAVTLYVPLEQILDFLIECGLCERRVHAELETSW